MNPPNDGCVNSIVTWKAGGHERFLNVCRVSDMVFGTA
jgi:hypothetical protein